ncbi:MAG TPA: aldose 1-epimerase [Burkholderiaceae bacterium]|nr:aldose 1-epimerase [Burkholderiaceae bacterium]
MSSSPNSGVELRAGALRLALRPDLGGSIAGLWHHTEPLMRCTEPAELASARLSACFPLVPYSNRLGFRRFRWQGGDYTTVANFGDSPHSLHGAAWMRPWEVISSTDTEAVLRYSHTPDEHWPFAFEVRQTFALTPQQLTLRFAFTNTGNIAQPVGLGWHPYFPAHTQSQLDIEVTDKWETDEVLLPTRKVPQRGIASLVSQLDVDNCFEGWSGLARIRDERFALELKSSLPYLVVFTPRDKGYFCVEPVSHVNDAIHMADPARHGLRSVETGQSTDAWMTLDIAPL